MQGNAFMDRWQLTAENVLAVLMAEEHITSSSFGYDRAAFEYGLQPMHFPPGNHRAAYQTIVSLRDEQKPVHAATISTDCAAPSQWVYGIQATYDITIDAQVFDANLAKLAQFGERNRQRRAIGEAAAAFDNGDDTDGAISTLMTELANTGGDEITNETAGASGAAFEQMMNESPDKLLRTGIDPMDAWMGGIGQDDVIGIVGAYKMRKSTVKRNVILNLVENGGSAAVCMLESNRTMVNAQFVSMLAIRWLHKQQKYNAVDERNHPIRWISGKDLVRVRKGYRAWHPLKRAAVDEGIKAFKAIGDKLRVYDKSHKGGALSDLASIRRVLLRDKKRYGTDISAIDHLLLIDEPGTDYEVMSKSSRFLEGFARKEKMSMLLLAQLNEASIRDGNNGHSPGVKGGGDLSAAVDYMFSVTYRDGSDGQQKQDDLMTICMRLSRYGEGGANVTADLRIDPSSGWILGVAA